MDPLCRLLSKFSATSLRDVALPKFPELDWKAVVERIERLRDDPTKPSGIATAIVGLAHKRGVPEEEFERRHDVLRLLYHSFPDNRKFKWFAYKLVGGTWEADVEKLTERVAVGTGLPAMVVRAVSDVESAVLGVGSHVLYLDGAFARRRVRDRGGAFAYVCAPLPKGKVFDSIVKGLGYESADYCHLHGQHVPSLSALLHDDRRLTEEGSSLDAATGLAPQRTPQGLVFGTSELTREHLVRTFGDERDAPEIQELTVHARAPAGSNPYLQSTAKFSSRNVELSLRDMAVAGILPPESVLLKTMIRRKRNVIKIKIT